MRASVAMLLMLLVAPPPAAAGPTDIARVDDYIGAAGAVRPDAGRARAAARRAGERAAPAGGRRAVLAGARRDAVTVGTGGRRGRPRGRTPPAPRPRRRGAARPRGGGAGRGGGDDGRALLLPGCGRVSELGGILFPRRPRHADRV